MRIEPSRRSPRSLALLLSLAMSACSGSAAPPLDAATATMGHAATDTEVDATGADATGADPTGSTATAGQPTGGSDTTASGSDGADEGSDDGAGVRDEGLVGWAAVPGYGVETTTGGGDEVPVVVTTAAELDDVVGGDTPRVIHVSGEITGNFTIGSNKTLAGLPGATLVGSLALNGSANVIIRDLEIVGWNCADANDCGDGRDAITVRSESHHIWLDHLDVSDGSDGNVDIVSGSDLVTVSWTRFHYSEERAPNTGDPHRFSNLIGSSDSATDDAGRLRVTMHHCWWAQRVNSRMPRVRFGLVHLFNNLYTSTGNSSSVRAAWEASLLVENNAFIGIHHPIQVMHHSDATALESRNNLFELTTGVIDDDRNAPVFTPPYPYALDPAASVEALVSAGVGPR